MTNVPPGAVKLLDFIGRAETGKTGRDAYDIIVFFKQDKLPKPLTEYTLSELLDAQKTWAKNWRGSAAGKYQIIRKTLLGLVAQMGIPGGTHFTPDVQDRFGFQLLTNRGWQAFASKQVTPNAFALQLAKEWASMPVLSTTQGAHRQVERGESYYAGDGVNSAQKKADELEAILAEVLGTKLDPTIQPKPAPAPTPPPKRQSLIGIIIDFILSLFKKGPRK